MRSHRLAAAIALVGTIIVSATAASPAPVAAGPCAVPAAPTIHWMQQNRLQTHLAWTRPPSAPANEHITYTIKVIDNATQKTVVTNATTQLSFDYSNLTAGKMYLYYVAAQNSCGTGPADHVAQYTKTSATADEISPFVLPSQWATRLYGQLLGRAPTAAEVAAAPKQSNTLPGLGDTPVTKALNGIMALRGTPRDPVIRLYDAYFRRDPDLGGLTYWTTAIRQGTRTLADVSQSFSSSKEFKTTYGSLSDAQFVTLIYKNILDRDPEPTGYTFWLDQLATHGHTRGETMISFSESPENKVKRSGVVRFVDLWLALIGTPVPKTVQGLPRSRWESTLRWGTSTAPYLMYLTHRPDYVVQPIAAF